MVLWQHVMFVWEYAVESAADYVAYDAQHDMLPQHHVYRNELNCECYNITLARRNIAP